jgi:carboxypeptidase C (cathepsin A)
MLQLKSSHLPRIRERKEFKMIHIHRNGMKRRMVIVGIVFSLLCIAACTPIESPESMEGGIVTTRHQVTVDGRTIAYTARAGRLPISDNETGEVHAHMFFAAYSLDRNPNQEPRPITFLWNGGPGSSSSLVHLLGFGPECVREGAAPVDNQGTWLEFTDLVFVDPVGTGYSRPTKVEYGPEFYQTKGDAESVAEFIRIYRNRFEIWDAPLFIGGESFGVRRAAGVAYVLQRRHITVDGVILISAALPLGELSGELRTVLMVPTYTAAAFTHGKLSSELQKDLKTTLHQAEEWAKTEYAQALMQHDTLSDSERKSILSQLAHFTGLEASNIDQKTLRISMPQFAQQLLRDRNQVIGRYDSRLAGPLDPEEKQYDPTKDPSLKNIIDDISVLRYLRHELRYKSDLLYQGPFGGGYPPPTKPRGDWMSVKWNWTPAELGRFSRETAMQPDAEKDRCSDQPLCLAMKANPELKVFIASGYFDLVCSYAGNAHLAQNLKPEIRQNVTTRAYNGGHAIYTDAAAQLEIKRDVAAFFQQAQAKTN